MSNIDEITSKIDKMALPDVDYREYFQRNQRDVAKIKRITEFSEELEKRLEDGDEQQGARLPFPKTHDRFAFAPGDVTLWSGYNGHFKSMLTGFVALDFIRQGERVCLASFEMKPTSTIMRMARQHCKSKKSGLDEVGRLLADVGNSLFLFDHLGQIEPERLYGVIQYAVRELGIRHFFIDSLMRVVAGEDSYNQQKDFVVQLCSIAKDSDCHIHLVHHARKGDEAIIPGRYEAKGSGAVADNVANSLIVWANKQGLPDKPQILLKCDKQRHGEWEGSLALRLDHDSIGFSEC